MRTTLLAKRAEYEEELKKAECKLEVIDELLEELEDEEDDELEIEVIDDLLGEEDKEEDQPIIYAN